MNSSVTTPRASSRVRAAIAALISLFLVVTGLTVAQPALAADGVITTSVTSASTSGVQVQVQASGLPADATGAYAALIVKGSEAGLSGSGGYAAFAVPFPTVTGGETSFSLTATAGGLDRTQVYEVLVWKQHSNPDATTIYARGDVSMSATQWDAVFPPAESETPTDPQTPTDPETPTDPQTPTGPETPTGPGTPTEPGAPATAAISVFLADGVTPAARTALKAGDTLVVKGSGYDPTANVGGRGVPIPANLPQGTYVVFGNFADDWKPSASAPSANRVVGSQAWALAEGVLNQVPTNYQAAIRGQWVDIAADGTFTATLTLKDTASAPGSYGVYTYPAGGVVNADQERSVALNYALTPTISVTPTVTTGATGITATVDGTRFGTATGVYAAVIETGTEANVTAGGGYIAMQYVRGVSGGAFTVALDAPASALDRTKTYEVLVWQQHTLPNASTILARTPITISAADWDAIAPAPAAPSISVFLADGVTPADGVALRTGDKVVVKGSGYDPAANVGGRGVPIPATLPQGTYVVFGNFAENWKPSASAPSANRSVGSQLWALAEGVLNQVPANLQPTIRSQWVDIAADGTFTATLTLKDAAAKPGAYGVYTYGAGGVVNADQERSVALKYTEAPVVTASVKSATEDGLTVAVTGSKIGDVTGAYVALIEKGTEADVTAGGGFLAMQFVRGVSGGAFTVDLTAAADTLDRSKTYEVIAWQQHTTPNASTIYARSTVTVTDAQWVAIFGPDDVPALTTTVKSATAAGGLTVTGAGTGLGDATGAYVALIEAGTAGSITPTDGFLAMQYVRDVADGAFSVDLNVAASKLDRTKSYEVIAWKQHTLPASGTIYATAAVAITEKQWDDLLGTPPVDPGTPPVTPPATVPGGSLLWSISSSFTNYITGPIAHGAIEVTGGATRSGGQFQFGQAVGSTYDAATGLGTVSYVGSVRFTGHNGILDVTVANPQIRITSANTATLSVTSGGSQVAFATLDLSSAVKTTANGAVTYVAAPASLTNTGFSQVFQGYSTTLNPVTFTIGSAAAAPAGSSGTVAAAAAVVKKATLPATPPTNAGIVIDDDNLAALQSGEPATITASGFQPNEKDIKVVVYSTPVLLDSITADASGNATWTGSLPATLENGEHTLTLQGSVSRGLAFTLARETVVIGACTIDGASLNWGFKESFRTYVEGIAKGGWTLTDVAYQYPDFVWANGSGSFDDETGAGLVTYGGSITFTGHDGALNTTLANFRIELAGDTGYIVVDVTGTTQAGEAIDLKAVRFAEFALGDAAPVDGVLTLDSIPAALTEAGATAFGTYAAGEELDPISAVIPVGADCGVAAPVEDEADSEASASVTAVTEVADEQGAPIWLWIVGGLVVVALVGAGGVYIGRRSKKPELAQTTTEV